MMTAGHTSSTPPASDDDGSAPLFLPRSRARRAAFDRVLRVVVAGGRGVAGHDEAINERLVLGRERVPKRAEVAVPLLLRAGAADHRCDEAVVQNPLDREGDGRGAAR